MGVLRRPRKRTQLGAASPGAIDAAFAGVPIIVFQLDREGGIERLAGGGLAAVGIRNGDLVGGSALAIFADLQVIEASGASTPFPAVFARVLGGESIHGAFVYRALHYQASYVPAVDASGAVAGIVGVAVDVTERVRAEAALAREEARYRSLVLATGQSVWTADAEGRLVHGPEIEPRIGISVDADEGWGWLQAVHPDERDAVREKWLAAIRAGTAYDAEFRARFRDGTYRQLAVRGVPVTDADGRVREWVGTFHDITDRQRLEEQLRQAQRMEAVGRLAGGVAHDFNNLLTVINGYADLVLARLGDDHPDRGDLEMIHRAGQRASLLTQQLLAFSRKQVLRPAPLSLNTTVEEVERMLSRVLGDDVAVRVELDPDAGTVRADPGQLQQVLMNLAVNARDAMPRGGTLTLRTRNVDLPPASLAASEQSPPSPSVKSAQSAALSPSSAQSTALSSAQSTPVPGVSVSVADTGMGMTDEVRARVFDPFFTTKEPGKGTGLGLSTVYGIVRQSGGQIVIDSEPGRGTTFTILLPRVVEPSTPPPEAAETPVAGGGECVLIVEDADAVGRFSAEVLRGYGYAVSHVPSAADAFAWIERGRTPDLLVTDVVLPGMSGPALAARLTEKMPGLAVLFMSGHIDDMLDQHGLLAARVRFLQKPFPPLALARAVRDALDDQKR